MTANITHLNGQFFQGGTEKQIFCLATALQRRGWQQSVVSFNPGGLWEDRLREAGIPVFVIPRSTIKPWRLWQLRRVIRHCRPRILLSWCEHVAIYARWLFGVGPTAKIFNVRCDLTTDICHGRPKQNLGMLQATLERSDYVVSNSARNLDRLRELGVRLPRAEVIRNIVYAHGKGKLHDSAVVSRIVAVGRLIPGKAYDVLLDAVAMVAEQGRAFEVLVAGNGPERARLESHARRLRIEDRVKFLGDVNDVPALLATAHILAHPARSEGLSNVILEAMAEGVPVVACPVGGTPELIEEGHNGILVPVDQPQALAVAIVNLLDDAGLRQRLGRAGSALVRDHFSEASIVDQYERVFRRLIDAQPEGIAEEELGGIR